jgi:hypothetical protein
LFQFILLVELLLQIVEYWAFMLERYTMKTKIGRHMLLRRKSEASNFLDMISPRNDTKIIPCGRLETASVCRMAAFHGTISLARTMRGALCAAIRLTKRGPHRVQNFGNPRYDVVRTRMRF